MNARVSTKVNINAPAAQVFQYIDHLEHHMAWNPKLDSVMPEAGQLKQGSQYESTSLLLGVTVRANNVITVYRPPHEIQIENTTGALHYNANYTLTTEDNQTIVLCDTTVSADSRAFKLAKPMLIKVARAELQADLRALKRLAEQKPE